MGYRLHHPGLMASDKFGVGSMGGRVECMHLLRGSLYVDYIHHVGRSTGPSLMRMGVGALRHGKARIALSYTALWLEFYWVFFTKSFLRIS